MKRAKKQSTPAEESIGTRIAAAERTRANGFSEEKRQKLLERGMSLIYGGPGKAKTAVSNR